MTPRPSSAATFWTRHRTNHAGAPLPGAIYLPSRTPPQKGAIRKALGSGRFVLPVHDRPAVVEAGWIVGRLFDSAPGAVHGVDEYPGPLTQDWERAAVR